jgi:choline transport protein
MDADMKNDFQVSSDDPEKSVGPEHGDSNNEMQHNFSVWSLASLCVCLMGTWEALSSVVAAALTNGGAPCLFYN